MDRRNSLYVGYERVGMIVRVFKKDKGLGDTIDRFTTATGIKRVVNAVVKNCGCDKRKELLNQKFPYK